jgi:hypothetical protein
MVNTAPASRTLSTLPSRSGRLSRQVGSYLLQLSLPSSKMLTGTRRIVYQVKYSHKPFIFIGLQNRKSV